MEGSHAPDEAVLRAHLESGRFISGVQDGRWRLLYVRWPYVLIGLSVKDGSELAVRFLCDGYPQALPAGQPWDSDKDAPLDVAKWPRGKSRIALAFNPSWKGASSIYLPCDRAAIEGHDVWKTQHPALLWDPDKGVCKYLMIVHEMLNSSDYEGRRGG